jgi:hypothetical protein
LVKTYPAPMVGCVAAIFAFGCIYFLNALKYESEVIVEEWKKDA